MRVVLLAALVLITACASLPPQSEASSTAVVATPVDVIPPSTEQSPAPKQGDLLFIEFFAGT